MKDSSDDPTSVRDAETISQRRQRAKEIVADVLQRRGLGQALTDTDILAAHHELAEELKGELKMANRIRQALLAARGGGPALDPLRLLSDSEIDDEIEPSSDNGCEPDADGEIRPQIPGYFLLEEISRGGQATVYKAAQESVGRAVAIKIVAGGPFVGSRHRARFEREARILAAFDHPNIVSIIERGRTPDGSFYFVMQFIDGLALDDYWKEHLTRDVNGTREVVKLFIKIARAVEAAHERGVVHRDLKPSNIRVDLRGEPHVLDFGLARTTGEEELLPSETLTMPGQIVGSLPWASPEQAAGLSTEVDKCSDVYSIGVILYQALTGQFPYSSEGAIDQILLRIRTAEAPMPSKRIGVRPGVDRRLEAIVLKALAKSRKDRYESAGALASDLEAWLSGKLISATPRKLGRRRKLTIAAMFLIACCIAIASARIITQSLPPTVIRLPEIMTQVGIRLVQVPSGSFWFGSPVTEEGHAADEVLRQVTIKDPFFVSISVVTQVQYDFVMHMNPSDPRWLGPNMPVQNVSWIDANEFCARLSKMEHRHFRLPSEAEWEYACRAGSAGPFNGVVRPENLGWYAVNSGQAIHPVMQKWPNAWGLFDMHGNVAQWCSDAYWSNAVDESTSAVRMLRGGNAFAPTLDCRSASRQSANDQVLFPTCGFRVVSDH